MKINIKFIFLALLILLIGFSIWTPICKVRADSMFGRHQRFVTAIKKSINDGQGVPTSKDMFGNWPELFYYNPDNWGQKNKLLFCSKMSIPFYSDTYAFTFGDETNFECYGRDCMENLLEKYEITFDLR